MGIPLIQQHLAAYHQWKLNVSRAIREFENWLELEGQASPETRERIRATLDALESDRLTIAFVAEFSRGKTELINAIFFADYGRRLLPSTAGRTTMCPTELLWDDELNEAYLRLLPIETRADETTIGDLKARPTEWVQFPLHTQHPEQMSSALSEILQTKAVSIGEATRLGLSTFNEITKVKGGAAVIEIPKWRHAIISFPHPLLKQGLTILDTPGLNALGSEPELTLSMLPAAQALLFVLAADTGVTRSDLEMWQHHLKGFQSGRQRGIMIALNKVDVLWDELQEPHAIEEGIAKQCSFVAETLGINEEVVFPVSAQKALLAKVRGDESLLRRSALPTLERYLSTKMVETKHQVMMDALEINIGDLIERNRSLISTRINHVKVQLRELEQLRDKSGNVIDHLLSKTREEQELYIKGVRRFQASREELITETRRCRKLLEEQHVNGLIEDATRKMVESWTTRGLNVAMKSLFDELRSLMKTVAVESKRLRKLVRFVYQQFEKEFGFNIATTRVFVPTRFQVELEGLYQEVDAFRRSPGMALTEQGIVIKQFQQQMVRRARALLAQLRATFDGWIRDALEPVAEQVQEHKNMMEKRLENLQRIGRSKEGLQGRVDEMQEQYVELAKQLTALRNIHNSLRYDPLARGSEGQWPQLVAG